MTDRVMSLAVTPGRRRAGDLDLHVLGLALDQRLGGQHMLDLGRADAMRQRAEGAMRGGVAVAADHGHARQGPALFGADDVDDALADVGHRVVVDAEILGVLVQRLDLDAAVFGHGRGIGAVQRGRHVVVRHGDGLFRRAHLAARHAQAFERLRAGHFMHQMAVDIQKAGAVVGLVDDMVVPDLVIEGSERSWLSHCAAIGEWMASRRAAYAATASEACEDGPRIVGKTPRQACMIGHVEEADHGGGYTPEWRFWQASIGTVRWLLHCTAIAPIPPNLALPLRLPRCG